MTGGVVTFHNQDAEFREWVRDHRDGLIVNVPNFMLHRTNCDHLDDYRTKAEKACAASPGAEASLRRWALERKGKSLLRCQTCET